MNYKLIFIFLMNFINNNNSFIIPRKYLKLIKFNSKIQLQSDNLNNNNIEEILKNLGIEKILKNLNSKNFTIQNNSILNEDEDLDPETDPETETKHIPNLRIIIKKYKKDDIIPDVNNKKKDEDEDKGFFAIDEETGRKRYYDTSSPSSNKKSKHFQVIDNYNTLFKDIGGYDNVKEELMQCVDILKNYKKYKKYNVRIPKGLIFEGLPGTGKTMLAKALACESKCNFIPVSGSDFQEKYVGVGSARVKELFELAKKNIPCIIFIDEIDALGRKRSSDGEDSSSERDNTLNALLVELDGFKNNTGIFLVAATNRIDLLDSALIRPGRIDKKIHISLPDAITREAIVKIHITGKPHDDSIKIEELVEITEGLSGAEIENLLNEAMLNALKLNDTLFTYSDFDLVMNKMMVGWQPNKHVFTEDIINHIAVHEMGHATVGLFTKHHSKITKVVINLFSPNSPGYTMFENSLSHIYTREALYEHLMILLAGRVAEEVFFNISVTTGAINDFSEALELAQKMIIHYGMGKNIIYPSLSNKYKELIDIEIFDLINQAYKSSKEIITNSKDFITETSEILKKEQILKIDTLNNLLESYPYLLQNKNNNKNKNENNILKLYECGWFL